MELRSQSPSLETYCEDVATVLSWKETHIFIDTSFLMWLTKLGTAAQAEFFSWVTRIGHERVHIPLWASHEYHQHFIDATIRSQTTEAIENLKKAARNFYQELQPAIVEAEESPRWTSQRVQTGTRDAVLNILRMGNVINRWSERTIEERHTDVIRFINRHVLKSGRTFDYFESIGQTTDSRFSGRVPPGFQDRIKKDTADAGGNRAGDLMFWREILDHAKHSNRFLRKKIRAVAVLSNDRKNDWVIGGEPVKSDGSNESLKGLRKEWSKIPVIHPMLEHEAQVYARVDRALLINHFTLGALFHKDGTAQKFVDASIATEMPQIEKGELLVAKPSKSAAPQKGRDKNESKAERPDGVSDTDAIDQNDKELLAEMSEIKSTKKSTLPALKLLEEITSISREKIDRVDGFITELLSPEGLSKSISHWVQEDFLQEQNTQELAYFGRQLANKAVSQVVGASQRLLDLIQMLDDIDVDLAARLYLGMLYGAYFALDNEVRPLPRPEVLQNLLAYQAESCTRPAIETIHLAFSGTITDRPAYLPNWKAADILVEVGTRVSDGKTILTSIVIDSLDFLIPVSPDDDGAIYKLLGIAEQDLDKTKVQIQEIALLAGRTLGFPVQQFKVAGDLKREVRLLTSNGLKFD